MSCQRHPELEGFKNVQAISCPDCQTINALRAEVEALKKADESHALVCPQHVKNVDPWVRESALKEALAAADKLRQELAETKESRQFLHALQADLTKKLEASGSRAKALEQEVEALKLENSKLAFDQELYLKQAEQSQMVIARWKTEEEFWRKAHVEDTEKIAALEKTAAIYLAQSADWSHQAAENLRAWIGSSALLKKMVKAWGDYRQHGSDGDTAVECCEEHFDAMDEVAQEAAALSVPSSGGGERPLPNGCVGMEHTSPDSWNGAVCEDCAPEGPKPASAEKPKEGA